MKTKSKNYFILFLLLQLLFFQTSFSQPLLSTTITVTGKIFDAENPAVSFPILMIVNLTTQHGIFGNTDGTFSTTINKKDTLIISVTGYAMKKICFADYLLNGIFIV